MDKDGTGALKPDRAGLNGCIAAIAADGDKEVGIVRAQFAAIADHAMHESWMHSNPRPITDAAQIMDILNAAE